MARDRYLPVIQIPPAQLPAVSAPAQGERPAAAGTADADNGPGNAAPGPVRTSGADTQVRIRTRYASQFTCQRARRDAEGTPSAYPPAGWQDAFPGQQRVISLAAAARRCRLKGRAVPRR